MFRNLIRNSLEDDEGWLDVAQSISAVIACMTDIGPRGEELIAWSLSTTLMSLVQLAVGRVVVSGGTDSDEDLVRKAFDIVAKATNDSNVMGDIGNYY